MPLPITSSSQRIALFLAGDFANRILCMTDRALNPAFRLIGLAFGFSLGIAQGFAGLLLYFASDLLHAAGYAIASSSV